MNDPILPEIEPGENLRKYLETVRSAIAMLEKDVKEPCLRWQFTLRPEQLHSCFIKHELLTDNAEERDAEMYRQLGEMREQAAEAGFEMKFCEVHDAYEFDHYPQGKAAYSEHQQKMEKQSAAMAGVIEAGRRRTRESDALFRSLNISRDQSIRRTEARRWN